MVVHHYHHADPQRTAGGGSFGFWLVISLLFPCIGFLVGVAFLCMPDRRGHGVLLIGLSSLFGAIAYIILIWLKYVPAVHF